MVYLRTASISYRHYNNCQKKLKGNVRCDWKDKGRLNNLSTNTNTDNNWQQHIRSRNNSLGENNPGGTPLSLIRKFAAESFSFWTCQLALFQTTLRAKKYAHILVVDYYSIMLFYILRLHHLMHEVFTLECIWAWSGRKKRGKTHTLNSVVTVSSEFGMAWSVYIQLTELTHLTNSLRIFISDVEQWRSYL